LLHADLPGVTPDNIDITMEDGVLTIQGKRESARSDKQDNYPCYERVTGQFLRRFALPDTANGEDTSAITRHDVLKVEIPKQTKLQPRKSKRAGKLARPRRSISAPASGTFHCRCCRYKPESTNS
jgi:HSP20 family protein